MKFQVVGESELSEVEAPTLEDAAAIVRDSVKQEKVGQDTSAKVVEIDESSQTILVKEVVQG